MPDIDWLELVSPTLSGVERVVDGDQGSVGSDQDVIGQVNSTEVGECCPVINEDPFAEVNVPAVVGIEGQADLYRWIHGPLSQLGERRPDIGC